MNLIKGFDRIAILLVIPVAIFGAWHAYTIFVDSSKALVYITQKEEDALKNAYRSSPGKKDDVDALLDHMKVFGYAKSDGIIADGEGELVQQSKRGPLAKKALDRAFKSGADRCGTLLWEEGGGFIILGNEDDDQEKVCNDLLNNYHITHDPIYIWPRKTRRILAGLAGAICYPAILILAIGISTRLFLKCYRGAMACYNWVKKGFIDT